MQSLFISNLVTDPWYYFSWVIIVAFSICVHEYAHAAVALRKGDDTAAREGHLSLNPLVQMGPTSLVLLFAIGMAWGAVPVNPNRFRRRVDGALVSLAGPVSNLLLSAVFGGLLAVVGPQRLAADFFYYACIANGVLFVLNMLPVPMLDGWSVFALLFPRLENVGPQQAQNISLLALVLLFVTPLWELIWLGGTYVGVGWYHAWGWLVGLFL